VWWLYGIFAEVAFQNEAVRRCFIGARGSGGRFGSPRMNTPPPSFGSSTPGPHQPEPQTAVRQLLPLTVWLCADPTNETTATSTGRESNGKDGAQLCLRHRQRSAASWPGI
jgi:hypothetical protein